MKTKVRMAAIVVILSIMSSVVYGQINLDKLKIKKPVTSVQGIKPYPNPSNSTVTLPSVSANTTIALYDANGQLIKTEFVPVNGDVTMNVSNLKSGVYYLEFTDYRKKVKDFSYLQVTK